MLIELNKNYVRFFPYMNTHITFVFSNLSHYTIHLKYTHFSIIKVYLDDLFYHLIIIYFNYYQWQNVANHTNPLHASELKNHKLTTDILIPIFSAHII